MNETITEAKHESAYELAQRVLEMESVAGFPRIWHVQGRWYFWTGKDYSAACPEAVEQRVLSILQRLSPDRINPSIIRSIVSLMRIIQHRDLPTAPCWLNESGADPRNLVVVSNGMLRIVGQSVEFLPHDPNLFGPCAVDYDYVTEELCPRWLEFLSQLWPEDSRARTTLQEWFGYCLLPDTSQQKILSIIGPRRSGKSTIARIQTSLLGHRNVASPSIRGLSGHFGLWAFLDKKLAIIPDATLTQPCPAVEELLKSVSGEDAVDIHRKSLSPLTGVRLQSRIMILANESPAFHDPSGALNARMMVLRTSRSFLDAEDIRLTETLTAELPGILNWAIAGLQRLNQRGRFLRDGETVGSATDSVSSVTVEQSASSELVAKLQQGRKDMADRCRRIGKQFLEQAGVERVVYRSGLSGRACPEEKWVSVPEPTTRRRLYVVAHEAGHVALNHFGTEPNHRQAFEAEKFAHDALRKHGIAVPRKSTQKAKKYVARKIRQAIRSGAKSIDVEALQWCKKQLTAEDWLAMGDIQFADLGT